MPRYTVEPGRFIHKNGHPFIYIARDSGSVASPVETDTLTHLIANLLNAHDASTERALANVLDALHPAVGYESVPPECSCCPEDPTR